MKVFISEPMIATHHHCRVGHGRHGEDGREDRDPESPIPSRTAASTVLAHDPVEDRAEAGVAVGQSGHGSVREVEHGRSEEEEGSEEEVTRGEERGAGEAEEEGEERELVRRQAQPGEAVQKWLDVLPDSGPKCRYVRVRSPAAPWRRPFYYSRLRAG